MITTKTYMARGEDVQHSWYVIDANNLVLGRMAVKIAVILMGKHKPEYTPHVDTGDFVIVVNADKIRLTGRKMKEKIYYSHTGYMGGLNKRPFEWMMKKSAERVVRLAVSRMIPKTKLGRMMIKKLKIYKGDVHPHEAQLP
ncbi:MAG: 50S ribosomal protein L13, partial [Candidatus Anammoxibacter sp.]